MRAPQRPSQPGVIGRLLAEPWRFGFAPALRLLLRWLAAHGVAQDDAYARVLTFHNSLSLAFPASELAALDVVWREETGGVDAAGVVDIVRIVDGAADGALPGDAGSRIDCSTASPVPLEIALTPAFIGLLGVTGALPLHDTQHIADLPPGEQRDGVCALMDVLSARMVALHCQAGDLRRLEHGLATGGEDRMLPLLLALSGVQPPPAHPYDHVAAHYAGLLRQRPVSAAAIAQVLGGYLGVPVACIQFAGCWDTVPPARRSVLGRTYPVLGRGAMLGTRLFRPEQGVRLDIGPLDRAGLDRFLPGGDAATALAALLRLCAAPLLAFEVRLLLAPSAVGPLVLGPRDKRRRLGWDSFLPDRQGRVTRSEVRYWVELE